MTHAVLPRLLALATAVLLTAAALLPSTTPQAAALESEPVAPDWVAACPANTIPFEEQGWWVNDFGHVHAGFCAPQGLTITGRYTFKVRLILHDNPGKLTRLQAQIDGASLSQGGQQVYVDKVCPAPGTCAWDYQISIDTSTFPYDGWHQIRMRAKVLEPDGNELVTSSFIPVYLNNGKPRRDYSSMSFNGSSDYVAGRGWYTNAGYVYSIIFDPRAAGERVSGIYRVKLRPASSETTRPLTRFTVKLDATHSAPGSVLYDTVTPSTTPTEIAIDTTKLADGWHSLLARAEAANQPGGSCSLCSGQPQTLAGTTKVWFYVDN